MDPQIKKIITAAKRGGVVLKKYFGKSLEIIEKTNVRDLQTIADLDSEKEILSSLSENFSSYNFFSEETGYVDNNSEFTFAIDPLDGTNNFILGIPNFSISIALLKNNEVLLGVVYVPMLDHVYYAKKDEGAFLNDIPLAVNEEENYERATIALGVAYSISRELYLDIYNRIVKKGPKRIVVNWSGAYDLCLLASGRIESMVVREIELYDFAAGKLIAREAGAIITDYNNKSERNDANNRFVASSTSEIHNEVLKAIV